MATTKEKIIIAASELFRKQGFHATTLNQISSASKTPRGSVYYYFPDGKEQLAKEAILRTGYIIKQRIEAALSQQQPIAELLYSHINRLADEISEQKDTTSIFSLTAISREISVTNSMLRETCKAVYDSWIDCFYTILLDDNFTPDEAKNIAITIQVMIE